MSIVVSDLSERLDTLTKLVLAEPVARIGHSRVTVRPLKLRGKAFFQLEYQQGQKVAHRNVARGALLETFEQELDGLFRSVTLCTETETRQYVRKTNGAYKCTAKSGASRAAVTASHNRKKEYILQEGENIPALVDLGVFTPEFKIVKAKYDKYKQINRFIELVDDAFRSYGRDEITILDFGCGKSYLKFVLYYYFSVKRGVRAKIIGYDESNDIAVLKIDASDLTPVVLGDSDTLNVGDSVVAIGNPLGELTFSMSEGIVSCVNRAINVDGTPFNMIQVDCSINPGNSGGPLFNSYGEVIGIVSSKYSSYSNTTVEGIGFAIPVNTAKSIISDLKENGYVTGRPKLGVEGGTLNQLAHHQVGRNDQNCGKQLKGRQKTEVQLQHVGQVVLQLAGKNPRSQQCPKGTDQVTEQHLRRADILRCDLRPQERAVP